MGHYEEQAEDEAVAEAEAAFESQIVTEIPNGPVPAIREPIAQHQTQN